MLILWKNLYECQTISEMPECDRKSDTRSVFQLYTSEMSDKDSSMYRFYLHICILSLKVDEQYKMCKYLINKYIIL